MLATCVLATSREPLGVDGEVEWLVPFFPARYRMNAKPLNRNEVVRLFLERDEVRTQVLKAEPKEMPAML